MRSEALAGSKVSVSTWRAPLIIDMSGPADEAEGVKERQVHDDHVVAVTPMRKAMSTCCGSMRWSCIAPLGKPVVPDV